MIKEADKIYTAGIIDGEGCISISCLNKRSYFYLRVLVSNTNKELVDYLKKTWGGHITKYVKENKNWKHNYIWCLSDNSLTNFLENILPYLKIKNKQARVGIKLRRTVQSFMKRNKQGKFSSALPSSINQYRTKLYLEMKELNKKGK